MTEKLAEFPESGKVIVGHPSREWETERQARVERLPYYLHSHVPTSSVYIFDLDKIDGIPSFEWEPR